ANDRLARGLRDDVQRAPGLANMLRQHAQNLGVMSLIRVRKGGDTRGRQIAHALQRLLDERWIVIFAVEDDDILGAAVDVELAVDDEAQIACVEPPAANG